VDEPYAVGDYELRFTPMTFATGGDTMKYLFTLNDSPYCSQHTYNSLRLARALAKGNAEVAVFLLGVCREYGITILTLSFGLH